MSKGDSGLFHNTAGSKATTNALHAKVRDRIKTAIELTPGSKKKAMIAGAYNKKTGEPVVAFSGEVPKKIHPLLLAKAKEIGGIGTHGLTDRNTVGVCAEFHLVNKMLLSGVKWSDIRITTAVRPRTGQSIPFCANCVAMFSDIIEP